MDEQSRIEEFLSGKRIAFVGLSRNPRDFSRTVFHELCARGYEVVPVHPGVEDIEGRKVFARVTDVPGTIDGALIMTPPEVTERVVRDCAEAKVPRVWLHRGAGRGSASDEAVRLCEAHGIQVVSGRCPLMFVDRPGFPHRLHGGILRILGRAPRRGRPAAPPTHVGP